MAVFHLKYRPQTLSELDSQQVRQRLAGILAAKEIPQSFLFTGPKGSGKTSAARIVAKAVNCLKRNEDGTPCLTCANCQSITLGKALDVVEIDAASNRGIDDIRALKEKTYLLPTQLSHKVFIIDEVHMLTKEAFNALLKLLEEPPTKTVFILCTTDWQKIPETIMSRLIRIDFARGNEAEMKASIERAVSGEGLTIDNETIQLIIDRSDGSFRNAQRMLTELFLEQGKNISFEKVAAERLNSGMTEADFEELLAQRQSKTLLEKIEAMNQRGEDIKDWSQRLLVYFQKRLLADYGIGDKCMLENKLNFGELNKILTLLIQTARIEKEVVIGQLPLELAVVEFCGEPESPGGDNNEQISNDKTIKTNVKFQMSNDNKDLGSQTADVRKTKNEIVKLEDIEKQWGQILTSVKPFNHSVEAFLRAARPKAIDKNTLIVEVFYPFHKDKLEETKNRRIVEDGLKTVLGADLIFECVLGKAREATVTETVAMVSQAEEKINQAQNPPADDIYQVAKDIFG